MLELIFLTLLQGSEMNPENTEFTFSQLQQGQHMIVNDSVMGGRSDSALTVIDNVVNFQGDVSLENNGGFASVRMIWPFDVSDSIKKSSVVVLKVKGDGLVYKFRLRTNRGFNGAAYSYSFKTLKDQIQTVYIPINDFVPSYRGRTLRNMPVLNFSDVRQMGILVADYQTGQFSIDLISLSLQ